MDQSWILTWAVPIIALLISGLTYVSTARKEYVDSIDKKVADLALELKLCHKECRRLNEQNILYMQKLIEKEK